MSSGGESEEIFQDEESSSQELSEAEHNSGEEMNIDGSSRKPKEFDDALDSKKMKDEKSPIDGDEFEDHEEQDKIDWQQIFLQEKVMGEP